MPFSVSISTFSCSILLSLYLYLIFCFFAFDRTHNFFWLSPSPSFFTLALLLYEKYK
ncbi:hypothetical protein DAPPUDRAFT_301255 [Daphnia pulex]|uniref:Uncharacterized protein n=1 Tax=Daphnia pulex TaxID=6669 RepID=E9I0Q1_DAPPU|nr:hypothetical protein DAPPUDRAFT_301255 [Daphnia pulex]|eukprot:EFX62429.1 hypothetical protein DAPPUDRAFT_301255 [Daphnia pulex]